MTDTSAMSWLQVVVLTVVHQIRTEARNLGLIAGAPIAFSAVIAAGEYFGRQTRHVAQLTWRATT